MCVKYLFSSKDLSELALGEGTSTYFARDKYNNAIHISNIDSLSKWEVLNNWKNNGKKDVILVLGNSQTHSINQMKIGEYNYIEILRENISSFHIIGNTFPNASLQDFLISYSYWKKVLPVKSVFIPLFFDDTREINGIGFDFYPQLVEEYFQFPSDTELYMSLNNSIEGMRSNSNNDADGEVSTQEKFELLIDNFLSETFADVWPKRKDAQGFIFSSLYTLRNFVFNINPSTVRRKIPERYDNNMKALDLIIKDAVSNNISIYLYIPPIRDDHKIPYDLDDYQLFIRDVSLKAEEDNSIFFKDYSNIVPSEYFGTKESTSLSKKDELDFMHFRFEGHEILGDSLVNYFLNTSK